MEIYARQGDLVIRREPVPSNVKLEKASGPVVLAGRETAPHVINAFEGVSYAESNGVQYLRTKNTVKISHAGRHTEATLEPGEYSVESLAEMRGDVAAAVED